MPYLNPENLPDARAAWIRVRGSVVFHPKQFSVQQAAAITCVGCQASRGNIISGPQMQTCAELFKPCASPTPRIVSGVLGILGRKLALKTYISNKKVQPSPDKEYEVAEGSSDIARLVQLTQEPGQLPCQALKDQ